MLLSAIVLHEDSDLNSTEISLHFINYIRLNNGRSSSL